MTAQQFRTLALSFEGAVERAHMGHPDFRANGRIFATLNADGTLGMVSLTPEVQQAYLAAHPVAFFPAAGAWGRQGSTMVRLELTDEETIGAAMTEAWRRVQAKGRKPVASGPARSPRRTARARRPRGT
jgi:hypothetical protein